MEPMAEILSYWIIDADKATAQPLDNASGFSGAQLWRVAYRDRQFLLRKWPSQPLRERITGIHGFQQFLSLCGLPVPVPVPALATGQSVVLSDGVWELAPWMPGDADYWRDPRPAKLEAALRMLARVHLAAARIETIPNPLTPPVGEAPGMRRREDRLHNLLRVEFRDLSRAVERAPVGVERRIVEEALRLIERALPSQVDRSLAWRDRPLPLQMCLRDVWHDHVLFTGDNVTGLIDFGAIGFDSPMVDVARLLGSMVADNREGWRVGLAAYESVRPLNDDERQSVDYIDSSGTLLSANSWIVWLWPKPGERRPPVKDRAAALARLGRLVERLRVMVERSG